MLLLIVCEQWHGISFFVDHFNAVARVRKLYVTILVCLGSAFVSLCRCFLVCGRQLLFMELCRKLDFFREGTDSLAKVTDLVADIPQEGAAFPSPHDHDFFQVHFGQIEFHGKP